MIELGRYLMEASSLNREITFIWDWYLVFLKNVIEIEASGTNERCFEFRGLPHRRIVRSVKKEKRVYDAKLAFHLPQFFFSNGVVYDTGGRTLNGEVIDRKKFKHIILDFSVSIYPGDKIIVGANGHIDPNIKDRGDSEVGIAINARITGAVKLEAKHLETFKPRVRGLIAHELKHFHDMLYVHGKMDDGGTIADAQARRNRKETDTKWNPDPIAFLNYYGSQVEVSAHVDQVIHYAKSQRISAAAAFQKLIVTRVNNIYNAAIHSGVDQNEAKRLVLATIDSHIKAFETRYPSLKGAFDAFR